MKKQGIIAAVYIIIAALYTAVSLILVTDRTALFWSGLVFFLIAAAAAGAVTVAVSSKRSSVFPMELSFVVFSVIYIIAVFIMNIVFCYTFKAPVRIFTSIQLMLLAIYAIIMLLLLLVKKTIEKNRDMHAE